MTDLNVLVKTGSTSLYLVFGNDINSRGEIAAYAFDQSNGEFHAALAIPCDGEHADIEACAESTPALAPATTKSSEIILPENVRNWLRQRSGFGRF